jgi:ADP-ribose pyrophosphatase
VIDGPGEQPSFVRTDEQLVHQGFIWKVATATFRAPDGSSFRRDVVRSPGAVGVVPLRVDPAGLASVVLVRQYRPVIDRWLLEIPAGMRDVAGEDPARTAERELAEEAGFSAGRLELLTVFHNSAGMTDAMTHVFLARDLEAVPTDRQGPEEDAMEVVTMPLAAALAAVEAGEITDAKTVIGLLLTNARLRPVTDHP